MTRAQNTEPTAEQTLTQVAQQMAMARPWDRAEPESLWVITGAYPGGKGTFTSCLAMTFPSYVTGCETPVFQKVGAWGAISDPQFIDPAWITHADPLLIVMRDEPTTPLWEEDRVWLS